MKRAVICLFAILGSLSAGRGARADTHAVVESKRLYMDQETRVTFEYWIGRDRSMRKAASRATITRDDLGLVWNLDLDGKSYTESVLRKPAAAEPSRHNPDMRKLWLNYYEPDYAWTIRDTGERRSVNGLACSEFRATGEADFAELSAVYWICQTPGVPGGKAFRDYCLSQYEGDSRMAALSKLLEENPDGFCAYREETVEPSIAPAARAYTGLTALEEAEAPPGTYDIPAGFKKLNGRGDR